MKKHLLIPVFFLAAPLLPAAAQSPAQQAEAKAREAFRLEDEQGQYDKAIQLLEEARRLDPGNITYPYELAYAYVGKKDYVPAVTLLEKLSRRRDVISKVYQLLGNTYDFQGHPDKAIRTYEKGLKKFPKAGELYLEMGNMHLVKKEYEEALALYEKGIDADPAFPSNYYWAAKIFCSGGEKVWGMIYGEIFMNLERNSKRTAEISKLLFDTYRKGIAFPDDSTAKVSFSKNNTIYVSKKALKGLSGLRLPYGTAVYETVLLMAVAGKHALDPESLHRIRERFLDNYYARHYDTQFPNVLFAYQREIQQAGQLEAYDHWILMKGDEAGFQRWQVLHQDRWKAFLQWFEGHPLHLDENHRFYRTQY